MTELMNFTCEKIGDVCKIIAGGTPPRSNPQFFKGDIAWVKISDMLQGDIRDTDEKITLEALRGSSEKILPIGTVLISIFATIGRTAVLRTPATTNQAILGITPNDLNRLSPLFLKCFLDSKHEYLNRISRGAAQPNINQAIIKNLEIPLPPLKTQEEISKTILTSFSLIELRRSSIVKLEELQAAIFHEMFGDISSNSLNWPLMKVSDFVNKFEGGKNLMAGSESGSPYRILKVSAVTSGQYNESESKPTPDNYDPPIKHFVKAGDLLFSRANTLELVGATAIVKKTNNVTLLPDKLWRFIWKIPMETSYVNSLFQTEYVRKELGKLSSGTSASMRNISQAKLFEMSLPIAPYDLQLEFAEIMKKIDQLKEDYSGALIKAQECYQSTLTTAFSNL
jgi:type I restriction enzyme S subunit